MSDAEQYRSIANLFTKAGLTRTILYWFLMLSLIPLSLVCWFGYSESVRTLRENAELSLREVTAEQSRFINNWFDFRFKDLRVQAESRQNSDFIKALTEGLSNSGKSPADFVASYQWAQLVDGHKGDLVQLMQIYAYYYDLLLIDLKGNVLFSIKQETDLGSNLLTGPHRETQFADIVRQSLDTGETLFSDYERYEPSGNIVTGFLTAPLIDEHGEKVGVFAVQLKVDTITELTAATALSRASQVSYLVGSDLISRSTIVSPDDILFKKIDTEQSRLWLAEHVGTETAGGQPAEQTFDYIGPAGKKVIGVHHSLRIGQVEWGLIAEVDTSQALAPARWMAQLTIIILVTVFFLVLVVAALVSRRITRPLKSLVDNIELAAAGELEHQVLVTSNDEIAQLAKAFNFMLVARQAFENELQATALQMQETLAELEEQRFALDQHAIVAITDTAGTITFVNSKFTAISGYSEEELIGQNHRLLNSGHHPKDFFLDLYATLARGGVWRDEVCNRAKNGSLYWVDSTIMPLVDGAGKTKSYIAIRSDITQRKMAELQNDNSLAIVEATLEATDNGIIVINEHGKALHHNQSFLELMSLNTEAVLFGDVRTMLVDITNRLVEDDPFGRVVEGIISSGGLFSAGAMHFKSGRIVEYNARELQLPDGAAGQVWSFSDITAQTLVAAELNRAKDEAEAATQAKGDFLANMSHEIRTPMNGVLGMLNLLSSTNLNNKQRHQVRLARSSGEALLTLINDILDFSKIEAGKLEMESIDFDLRLLLGELAEGMALQAQSKGLEIVLDLARIEQSRVLGDPTRIRQLFVNLISNALKFTSEGEVVIRAALYAGDVGEMILEASVEDTGMGIPSAQIGHLFDSFSQVDASTTRKFGGTGLGLAIVKKLCHLMGGDISVTSEPAKGSCFAFNLSLGLSEQAAIVRPVVDLHGVRILVVDDNVTNREVLEQQLSLWGAYVTEADCGDAALRIINEQAEEPFPVAIIDMQMPNMDGAELGRTIRTDVRFQSTALIMMTSMSEPGDAQFFAKMGFAAYFPKPTTTSDLFDALAVVLGGGEALQAASPLVTPNYLRSLDAPTEGGSPPLSLPNSGFRLLLVEDNVINQHVAQGLLEDMGYCADIAANGAVAIESLQAAPADAPYQLVFMDCQMPVIDGYEATAKIRAGDAGARYRDIPIVAMTANAMAGDRVKCLEAGMDDYIAKPIDPDLLEGILTQYQGLSAAKSPAATSSAPTPEGQGAGRGEQTTRPESHGEADQEHPVWDREGLLRRVRGNESLMLTLLQQFILDMPQQVEQLEQAVADEDLPQVSSLAHTIKGIAGNLSGQRLQHLAAAMEQSASQGESEDLQRQWTNFAEQYRQLYLNLEEYTQVQASAPVAAPAQSETQGERVLLIEQLRAKLEQGSYVDAGDLQPFEAHCQEGPEQALLTALSQQLSQFDMPAALVSLNQLAAVLTSEE